MKAKLLRESNMLSSKLTGLSSETVNNMFKQKIENSVHEISNILLNQLQEIIIQAVEAGVLKNDIEYGIGDDIINTLKEVGLGDLLEQDIREIISDYSK